MKMFAVFFLMIVALGFSGMAYAETNPVAGGVNTVSHAPVAGLKDVNGHLFTPVKEVNAPVRDAVDAARRWVVDVGLNLGQAIAEYALRPCA